MTRSGGGIVGGTRLEGSNGHSGYAFGPFVVDSIKRQLWRERRLVPITSKTFDVLVVLLQHRDHIVSKDELLNRVWPDTAVNENNLARQISSLRRTLGQRPDQHDFVVTIPGHGYRFVATVQDLPDVRPELSPVLGADRDIQWYVAPEPSVGPSTITAPPMSFWQRSPSQESTQRTAIRVHRPNRAGGGRSSEHSWPRAAGSLPQPSP